MSLPLSVRLWARLLPQRNSADPGSHRHSQVGEQPPPLLLTGQRDGRQGSLTALTTQSLESPGPGGAYDPVEIREAIIFLKATGT